MVNRPGAVQLLRGFGVHSALITILSFTKFFNNNFCISPDVFLGNLK
jgi:hypothetical protein